MQFLHDFCPCARSDEIGSGLQKVPDLLDGLDATGSLDVHSVRSALAQPSNLLGGCDSDNAATGVLEIGDSGFDAELDGAIALSVVEEREFEHDLDRDSFRSFDDAVDVREVLTLHSGEQEADVGHEVDLFDAVFHQLSHLEGFSGTGHRAQRKIDKGGGVNSRGAKCDGGLAHPAGGDHRGLEVVLKAVVDVRLPLGASYGIRDEGGLDVTGEAGVGVIGARRDVGSGHRLIESAVLRFRRKFEATGAASCHAGE